jgi:hypothetical protein
MNAEQTRWPNQKDSNVVYESLSESFLKSKSYRSPALITKRVESSSQSPRINHTNILCPGGDRSGWGLERGLTRAKPGNYISKICSG